MHWLVIIATLLLCACNGKTSTERPAKARPTVAPTSTAPEPAPKPGVDLRILSYNVLATPVYKELRTRAVLGALKQHDADIIALQEVAPWFLKALLAKPWTEKYALSERRGEPFAPGGQFIMARRPIVDVRVAVLPGRQRRTVLIADVQIDGRIMSVATTHMESFLEDGATRARQLTDIFTLLQDAEDALFLGDLNFGDGSQPETSKLDASYVDLWSALHPGDPGYTWNIDDNPMARIGAFVGEPNRRLDRILMRSSVWRPKSITIMGDQSAGQRKLTRGTRAMIEMPDRESDKTQEPMIEVFPSDHYGLAAAITR